MILFVAGPFCNGTSKSIKPQGMDPLVLIDALISIMGHEEKELCKLGQLSMAIIVNTAVNIVGSKDRVSLLGFIYIVLVSK